MLKKKYVVQKSFRIDARLENDLEQLSTYLNRPQNELVNRALEIFMSCHKIWFMRNIFNEFIQSFLNDQLNTSELKIANISIKLTNQNPHQVECHTKVELPNNTIEEDVFIIDRNTGLEDVIKSKISNLNILLDQDSPDIDDYLEQRLNYR